MMALGEKETQQKLRGDWAHNSAAWAKRYSRSVTAPVNIILLQHLPVDLKFLQAFLTRRTRFVNLSGQARYRRRKESYYMEALYRAAR